MVQKKQQNEVFSYDLTDEQQRQIKKDVNKNTDKIIRKLRKKTSQKSSKPRKKRNATKRPLNLAKLIRKHAYVTKGKRKTYLKVSAESEKEIISRIIIAIEDNMPLIAEIAYDAGRTTIKAGTRNGEVYDDVTKHFGYMTSKVIAGEDGA